MNRFNAYMNNHFAGCKLLAESWDDSRKRDVRMYVVPGFVDCIGITDGTDSWISPVSASCFSVNIERQMRDLFAGDGSFSVIRRQGSNSMPRRRVSLKPDVPTPAPRRRVSLKEEQPTAGGRARVRI